MKEKTKGPEHLLDVTIDFFGERRNIVMIKAIADVSSGLVAAVAEDLHTLSKKVERVKLGEAGKMFLHAIAPRTVSAYDGGRRHIEGLREKYYDIEEDE